MNQFNKLNLKLRSQQANPFQETSVYSVAVNFRCSNEGGMVEVEALQQILRADDDDLYAYAHFAEYLAQYQAEATKLQSQLGESNCSKYMLL